MHPFITWVFFISIFAAIVLLGQDIRTLHQADSYLATHGSKPAREAAEHVKMLEEQILVLKQNVATCEARN